MRKVVSLLIPLLVLLGDTLLGQWQIELSSGSYYYQNLLRTYANVEDYVLTPGLSVAYLSHSAEFYYSNYFLQVMQNQQYSFGYHEIGVDWFDTKDRNWSHSLGASVALRSNRDDFQYNDYSRLQAAYNFKWYPRYWLLTRLAAYIQYKHFPEVAEWNHSEASLQLQQNVFLKTNTTLRAGMNLRFRDFVPYTTTAESAPMGGGQGWRRIPRMIYRQEEISSLWLLSYSVRIAQSLGKYLGAYSEVAYQYLPDGGNPYEFEVQAFSPIDDYFGYSGLSWMNSLKFRYNDSFWLQIRAAYYDRLYVNRPVYEFDEASAVFTMEGDEYVVLEPQRIDQGRTIEFRIGFELGNIFQKASSLDLILHANWQQNDSNDAYFQYDDISTGLTIGYDFQW